MWLLLKDYYRGGVTVSSVDEFREKVKELRLWFTDEINSLKSDPEKEHIRWWTEDALAEVCFDGFSLPSNANEFGGEKLFRTIVDNEYRILKGWTLKPEEPVEAPESLIEPVEAPKRVSKHAAEVLPW